MSNRAAPGSGTPRKPTKETAAKDVEKERSAVAVDRNAGKAGRNRATGKPAANVPDIGNTMSPEKYGSDEKK